MRAKIIVLLCCWGMGVMAQEREYRVGVEMQDYLPFYAMEDGAYHGYSAELLDAFAQAEGYRFTYVPLPVKRLLGDFLAGKLDFKFPDHPQWSVRQKQGKTIHYSEPVAPFTDGVLVAERYRGQGKARLKVLGTLLGFTPSAYLEDVQRGRITLSQSTDVAALLRMVDADRVDGIYLNVRVAQYRLEALGLGKGLLAFDPQLPHVRSHYHLSSIEHPQVIAQFDAFLEERAEWIGELRKKWRIEPD
jgi:ABC-type amino acid transport substrate-binding protein